MNIIITFVGVIFNIHTAMAQPIKETPVLYGKDARLFERRMKECKPVSPERKAEMERNYAIFKKIAQFPLP
jgi:hypothetical protein